jgi:anti-anti-sigma factor
MTRVDLVWTIEALEMARIVAPAGRIDEASATGFAERLTHEIECASSDGVSRLAIDLANIEYMSSRGLRGLTLAQRKSGEHGITIVLAQPNQIMREILAISRYDMVFQVFESIEQAVAA